ncbi:NAD-dependent malic enzyme [Candidatus Woesearchaeota archaeon CG10_big_fil_rev_8_21_14_0_10_37_12]|nr:MAG: NAD-dependent malic enzyme [Candidatus Woesearchaeota archaeon CG10_big_fil_rev_8_21_14_0_10_37_12]
MTLQEESLRLHEKFKGKLEITSKVSLKTRKDLSLAYTPGVAEPCRFIAKDKENIYKYTIKQNTVAVISDGSAVLGLGNIGPEAALPVMEGKAILFKELGGVNAFPICLASQDTQETIKTIKNIAPVFGGINLEDFKAPECFEIEAALQDLGIPVMHDDQHGTAIVVLAAMINALKVVNKKIENVKVVINGAGAAGTAITKLLLSYGLQSENTFVCDRQGVIFDGMSDLKFNKAELAKITNTNKTQGTLADVIKHADAFIGVSSKNALSKEMVQLMNKDAIVMAMANPDPEILPDVAKEAGAKIVATGRSDFPNQINNVLAFPGIFKGALQVRATRITEEMKIAAAEALAKLVEPTENNILPYALDKGVADVVAKAVAAAWEINNK